MDAVNCRRLLDIGCAEADLSTRLPAARDEALRRVSCHEVNHSAALPPRRKDPGSTPCFGSSALCGTEFAKGSKKAFWCTFRVTISMASLVRRNSGGESSDLAKMSFSPGPKKGVPGHQSLADLYRFAFKPKFRFARCARSAPPPSAPAFTNSRRICAWHTFTILRKMSVTFTEPPPYA